MEEGIYKKCWDIVTGLTNMPGNVCILIRLSKDHTLLYCHAQMKLHFRSLSNNIAKNSGPKLTCGIE